MKSSPFLPEFDRLPSIVPIFPLAGVVVLPGVQLPLNIFEPRYLSMVQHALAEQHIIGMVQPAGSDEDSIHRIGCAGRITSYSETNDGRIVLVLSGFCRFRVLEEAEPVSGFRRARVSWDEFAGDYNTEQTSITDRERFIGSLRSFCTRRQVEIPWDDIAEMADDDLVNLLCTHLPLDAGDKQALIETVALEERATLMRGLMDMSALSSSDGTVQRH
ncbi:MULTISPECIES: LON peptidase substrate-binding domain-containing protein [Thiorhodovibrio]|uniref:LON peptidase substrate-binding domain-containing protein n=1 Tax=Thiorhodovibrio TaxID=61593 RepID=UPI00191231A0|nr:MULTISPECIES: LON peptidase substrate-binding domain-containing protein [Thiorhodovibrio]MBK5971095.1 peptidase S16 [Thiorhodovibrio winogradskyi]WPL10537.1 Lon protease 2 [Thiorhodovibrio litoralis]